MFSDWDKFINAYSSASPAMKEFIDSGAIGDEAESMVDEFGIEKSKQKYIVQGLSDAVLELHPVEQLADYVAILCGIGEEGWNEFVGQFREFVRMNILNYRN